MPSEIQNIWGYLSSAWSEFQDKTYIENFWQALLSGMHMGSTHIANTQFSRTISYMYPVFDYGPETYKIIYSGLSTEVNVDVITTGIEQIDNGGFEVSTSGWGTGLYYGGFSRSNSHAHTGSYSLKTASQGGGAVYDCGAKKSSSSTITAWVYISSIGIAGSTSPGDVAIEVFDENDSVIATVVANHTILNSWQRLSLYTTLQTVKKIGVRNNSWMSDVYWDDISLIKTGAFEYTIPEYTYSIPTLRYQYVYNGITYSGVYTEGTDYLISNELNSILWLQTPTGDRRFSSSGVLILTADHRYQINPVLAHVWSKQCGFNIKRDRFKYRTFGNDTYVHLKFLIWALVYYQRKAPSIDTLKQAYGVARGLPFAYASGMMNYTVISGLYNVTIDDYTYIFPSGVRPLPSGYYDQFDIIGSGLDLYDYVSNPTLVNQYSNVYNRRATLIYREGAALSGLSFSQEFLNAYIAKIMPEQIQYLII